MADEMRLLNILLRHSSTGECIFYACHAFGGKSGTTLIHLLLSYLVLQFQAIFLHLKVILWTYPSNYLLYCYPICYLSLIHKVAQFCGFFLLQPWLPAYRCPGWPGGFERDVEWEVTQAFSSLQLSWGRPNSILPQLVPLHFCRHYSSQDLPPHLGRLSLRGNQGEFLFLTKILE